MRDRAMFNFLGKFLLKIFLWLEICLSINFIRPIRLNQYATRRPEIY